MTAELTSEKHCLELPEDQTTPSNLNTLTVAMQNNTFLLIVEWTVM